jgi:prepilin-type processing-associated H-X9-DG protein
MTGQLYPTDRANKIIVADKSDKSLSDGPKRNSANHGHRFTNVLFFDGKVRTCDQPYLPPGVGSEPGSIYIRETGLPNDTYIE